MIEKHDTWYRDGMLLAVILCLAVSATTLTRVQFVEAQTVKEPEKKVEPPVQDQKKVKVFCRVLKPDGEVADGIVFQFNDYPNGETISSGGGIPRDGVFDVDLYADRSYIGVVFDKFNRFAAPLQRFTTGDKASENEIVFQLEEGVPLRASFIDETTNKPISGLKIYLAWEAEIPEQGHWIMFEKTSDENGLFEAHVMPGNYVLSIDQQFIYPDAVQKGVYARNVIVEDKSPVDLEFRIPTPFTGKLVNIDGTPARNRLVFITPSNLGQEGSQGFTATETDQNGVFRRIEPPVNASVSVLPGGGFMGLGIGQYFAWFDDELADMKEKEFWLVKEVVVSGHLLDAKTQKPLANQLFFHWKKNPKDLKQQAFMPEYSQTDGQGRFRIRLNPMLAYELFVVYGRQARHGGGPYYPRIALTTLEPESLDSKSIVDLGDLQVDPAKLIADPYGNLQEIAKNLQVQKQRVERGEKKALLRITVKDGAEKSWKYIETHQDENPLSSFAVLLVRYDDLPEEFRRTKENSGDEKVKESNQEGLVATFMDFRGESTSNQPFPPQITLSELRGEKDSPWNVPKDDPSNEGEWKQTPGMVNPKILDNFLNDYLKKVE